MPKIVIRSHEQMASLGADIRRQLAEHPVLVEYKEYRPPRTLPQNSKIHAMLSELAQFTGDDAGDLKNEIKRTDVWPKKERWVTRVVEEKITKVRDIVPVGVHEMTREQASLVIELINALASNVPGFYWSEERKIA